MNKYSEIINTLIGLDIKSHTLLPFYLVDVGALAVESLHKQVLPFLLRRLKTDVLKDLPPKIIQDYYCELSPLQVG